jgi:predicted kinase
MAPTAHRPPSAGRPTLFVMVGLPAAGKTTRARALAAEHRALRLTPDEWMIPLFHHNDAGGMRDVLEGRFVALAREALGIGVSVVLDFGVWSRDERSALRSLAAAAGADCQLVYLPVSHDEAVARHGRRFAHAPHTTFDITSDDLRTYRERFDEPDAEELSGGPPGPPPVGFASWDAWAAERWPTSAAAPS